LFIAPLLLGALCLLVLVLPLLLLGPLLRLLVLFLPLLLLGMLLRLFVLFLLLLLLGMLLRLFVLFLPLLLLGVLWLLLLLSVLLFGLGLLMLALLLCGMILLFALLLMLCISGSSDCEKQRKSRYADDSSYSHKCYLHCRLFTLAPAQPSGAASQTLRSESPLFIRVSPVS